MRNMTTNAYGYANHIRTYVQARPAGEPILTAAVADDLADTFGIDTDNAKNITNVNIKRLSDKGELVRVQKGVYGRAADTAFGRVAPNTDEVMAALLLRDGDRTIGYITGPTLLNSVGLCTWMPKDIHITTNGFRRRIPRGANIRSHKPVIPVNDDNVRYLRTIGTIEAMERYPVDAERPDEVLREILHRDNIDNERLIWFARKYFGRRTLLRTIDVALGDIRI